MYVIAGDLFRHHHALGHPARPPSQAIYEREKGEGEQGQKSDENAGGRLGRTVEKPRETRMPGRGGQEEERGGKRRKEEERRERGGAVLN
jgi:hypothetical protein